MLKLWGRTSSINVQKVLWTLTEIGLPYERVDAGLSFGGVNEPWYRAMNPNGRVPTIDDDGFVLWESNSIVRYLASKHGAGTLLPDNLQTRADADRWMDWATRVMGSRVMRVMGSQVMGSRSWGQRSWGQALRFTPSTSNVICNA